MKCFLLHVYQNFASLRARTWVLLCITGISLHGNIFVFRTKTELRKYSAQRFIPLPPFAVDSVTNRFITRWHLIWHLCSVNLTANKDRIREMAMLIKTRNSLLLNTFKLVQTFRKISMALNKCTLANFKLSRWIINCPELQAIRARFFLLLTSLYK